MRPYKFEKGNSRVVATSGSVTIGGEVSGNVIMAHEGNITARDRSNTIKPFDMEELNTERLLELLGTRFTFHEITRIAFELGVDYDDLEGISKHDKVNALLDDLNRQDRLRDLVEEVGELRPDVSLDSVFQR